jgi:endonuclease YncB( thermonuclease family)
MLVALLVASGLALTQPAMINGDTLRDGGERYRVENIDAPERGARARGPEEKALAEAARAYVAAWVAEARRVEARPIGRRDRYGRIVAFVQIDGIDLGERRMARALAQPWRGRKADFCSGACYCQPLDDASAATSLVGRAISPFCVISTS